MHDPEDQNHAVLVNHVVHDPVISHKEPVEGVIGSADSLDPFPPDPTRLCDFRCQALERAPQSCADVLRELAVGASSRGPELDLV